MKDMKGRVDVTENKWKRKEGKSQFFIYYLSSRPDMGAEQRSMEAWRTSKDTCKTKNCNTAAKCKKHMEKIRQRNERYKIENHESKDKNSH